MNKLKNIIGIIVLLACVGCSNQMGANGGFFHDRAQDFSEAKATPALVLPEKINARGYSERYTVPPLGERAQKEIIENPIPPGFNLAKKQPLK